MSEKSSFFIVTDSSSDLPQDLMDSYRDFKMCPLTFTIDGEENPDIDIKTFYDRLRNGSRSKTSQVSIGAFLDVFRKAAGDGMDVLYVGFSSGLSGTVTAGFQAAEIARKEFPERKFIVVDTLRISGPMTLLVLKAHEMYRAGKSIEEVAGWLEENKLRAQAYFIVDDLKYLKRGGRISATAATVDTMLDLKPIISEAADGTLGANDKIRGRKKAIAFIVDKMLEYAPDPAESPIIVLNADSPEDAERTKTLVEQKLPGANVLIENVGPVIGAHAGPGTIALCFIGTKSQA